MSIHESKLGFSGLAIPMLAVLFSNFHWGPDPRLAPATDRFVALRKSLWSWDQLEAARIEKTIDFDSRSKGAPLLVTLGSAASDRRMMQKMISSGRVNVNSSDWGCTPLLAALDRGVKTEDQAADLSFAEDLLRAGANPNLLPTTQSVDSRLAAGNPSGTCGLYDRLPNEGRKSILRIVVGLPDAAWFTEFLLDRGAKPRDAQDGREILEIITRSPDYVSRAAELTQLFSGAEAEVTEDAPVPTKSLATAIQLAVDRAEMDDLNFLLKQGTDVNKRLSDGRLPLEKTLDQCRAIEAPADTNEDETGVFASFFKEQWREADKKARNANTRRFAVMQALLVAGASPNLSTGDAEGDLLRFAVDHCSSEIPKLLVRYGARISEAAVQSARFDLKTYLQGARLR